MGSTDGAAAVGGGAGAEDDWGPMEGMEGGGAEGLSGGGAYGGWGAGGEATPDQEALNMYYAAEYEAEESKYALLAGMLAFVAGEPRALMGDHEAALCYARALQYMAVASVKVCSACACAQRPLGERREGRVGACVCVVSFICLSHSLNSPCLIPSSARRPGGGPASLSQAAVGARGPHGPRPGPPGPLRVHGRVLERRYRSSRGCGPRSG